MKLLMMQQYRCALSGDVLTPETAALDHKVAVSNGGTHDIENLQWIHKHINAAKGTMSNSAFVSMCQAVSTHISSEVVKNAG